VDLRHQFAEQGLQRIGGGQVVPGNRLRVLRDARENYPAWLAAIDSARRTIQLEMYIVHEDATGRRFRGALVARAKAGVTVRILYDWFGSLRLVGLGFWAPLRAAGGDVWVANPPGLESLLGWACRDHRKLLTVDGSVAFISGLCIGDAWVGDPARGIAPWRRMERLAEFLGAIEHVPEEERKRNLAELGMIQVDEEIEYDDQDDEDKDRASNVGGKPIDF
jgi:cardiolipin synthase A/B